MLLDYLPNVGYGYHSYLFICFLSNPLYLHGSPYCMYIWIKFTCCATVDSLELCHFNSFLLWLKYTKLCYTRIMMHGISLRFTSLTFHRKLCYMFRTENSERCLFITIILWKRARKLTSKSPMRPLFSGRNVAPELSPEASLRKRRWGMLSSQETHMYWDRSYSSVLVMLNQAIFTLMFCPDVWEDTVGMHTTNNIRLNTDQRTMLLWCVTVFIFLYNKQSMFECTFFPSSPMNASHTITKSLEENRP